MSCSRLPVGRQVSKNQSRILGLWFKIRDCSKRNLKPALKRPLSKKLITDFSLDNCYSESANC